MGNLEAIKEYSSSKKVCKEELRNGVQKWHYCRQWRMWEDL